MVLKLFEARVMGLKEAEATRLIEANIVRWARGVRENRAPGRPGLVSVLYGVGTGAGRWWPATTGTRSRTSRPCGSGSSTW
jgi:hypothetical protein